MTDCKYCGRRLRLTLCEGCGAPNPNAVTFSGDPNSPYLLTSGAAEVPMTYDGLYSMLSDVWGVDVPKQKRKTRLLEEAELDRLRRRHEARGSD